MKHLRFIFAFFYSLSLAVIFLIVVLIFSYQLARIGLFEWPVIVKVQGHSMEPTLKDGERLIFSRFFENRQIHRGDIVAFKNEKTKDEFGNQVGYVKRIIALPEEEVMLRDGFITINGKVLEEPYIKAKKSTYSESFTPECRKIKVPKESYFVLGDNRMSSKDSRDFGFVKKTDVFAIRYYKNTFSFSDLKIELDAEKIIDSFNQERKENGFTLLTENKLLDQAALLRAQAIAEYNDWTEGAKKSNFSYLDAIRKVGYSNILYAEIFDGGYLNTEDLVGTWQQNESVKQIYLDPRYQDIGVGITKGSFGDCDVLVVSVILGGYEPPNYSQEVVSSWKNALNNLKEIYPSWQELKNNQKVYEAKKAEIDRICEIISLRIARIEKIIARFENNEYLTSKEKEWMEEDEKLAKEQSDLADEINSYIQGKY
ncbi:signal peptidase I [bacterium]|nr:signal peptidase I [bacterium]